MICQKNSDEHCSWFNINLLYHFVKDWKSMKMWVMEALTADFSDMHANCMRCSSALWKIKSGQLFFSTRPCSYRLPYSTTVVCVVKRRVYPSFYRRLPLSICILKNISAPDPS